MNGLGLPLVRPYMNPYQGFSRGFSPAFHNIYFRSRAAGHFIYSCKRAVNAAGELPKNRRKNDDHRLQITMNYIFYFLQNNHCFF